jgi:hypothetical protein
LLVHVLQSHSAKRAEMERLRDVDVVDAEVCTWR